MRARLLVLTTLVSVSLLSTARADTKSWAAIKGKLPASASMVASANLIPARALAAYAQVTDAIIQSDGDFKEGAAGIKSACGIDVTTVISDVTFVANPKSELGLIVVGLDGIDQKKALSCANLLAKAAGGGAITGKARGKITEYSMKGEKEKLYAAWLTKDVIAVASDPKDKALLTKLIGGKSGKGDLATAIGKTSTDSVFWVASGAQDLGMAGTIRSGFMTVELAAGKFTLNGHATLPSAELAKSTVADILSDVKKERKDLSPAIGKLVDRMTLIANEAEIVLSAAATDAEILPALIEMMK